MSPAATEGYYFVIHFSRDGTACFFNVGCGSTIWKEGSLIPLKEKKLLEKTELAKKAILSAQNNLGSYTDQITLKAKAPLPRTFEQATVIAKKISYNDITSTNLEELLEEGARFLKIIYDFQKVGFDLTPADQAELEIMDAIKPIRRKQIGTQGFGLSAPEKKAVEMRAMDLTKKWFEDKGYKVKDTSSNKPYDLIVIQNL